MFTEKQMKMAVSSLVKSSFNMMYGTKKFSRKTAYLVPSIEICGIQIDGCTFGLFGIKDIIYKGQEMPSYIQKIRKAY